MDDLSIQGQVVDQTLKELDVINKVLGGDHATISGIRKILRKSDNNSKVLRIADMGCGGGDMLKKIAKWANGQGISVKLTGIDANPAIIEYAKENTNEYDNIEYVVVNVFEAPFQKDHFDIIISTLFLHHFNDEDSSKLILQWMQAATLGIVINDIHRHPFAYHSIKLLTRFLSKSYMVRNDAPVSVLRAFKRSDLIGILQTSGFHDFSLNWKWAFRWRLVIRA